MRIQFFSLSDLGDILPQLVFSPAQLATELGDSRILELVQAHTLLN